MVNKFTLLLVLVLMAVPAAYAASPRAHGSTAIRIQVCQKTVSVKQHLSNTNLETLTGTLGSRQLRYWNESPSTSYFYGVNTFVRIGLSGHTLSVRAVRMVPVCAPLRISYSW